MAKMQVAEDAGSATAAIPPSDRIDAIDAVRGFALFGVLAVNLVTEFRVSIFQQFLANEPSPKGWDSIAESFVSFALESKAFSLFSILFGIGLAMQFERLSRRGRPYYLLTRRLIVLLGFGLIHLIFVWNGDILTEYALAGLLILPLLALPRGVLAALALCLFVLYAALPMLPPLVAWPSAATLTSHVALANHVYSTGTYPEVWRLNVDELPLLLPLHVFVFPRTLALFVFGAFIWRTGILKRAADHRRLFLGVALAGIFAGLGLTEASDSQAFERWGFIGGALSAMSPIVLAAGYASVIISISQIKGTHRFLAPFAAVGRMAFTNYILQSVIFGFIFFGYGIGLLGRLGAGPALVIGIVVYATQACFSVAWLKRFRFGPLEWLWRTLMYGQPQSMRVATGIRSRIHSV
jgi:uncharacterized protein